MGRVIRVAATAALAVFCSTAAFAQSPYSSLYVFGDSLSDAGRVPGLILAQDPTFPLVPPPPVSPPYFGGRFSNGPVWVELLPGLIGAPPSPAQNFAVGGAETNTDNLFNPLLSAFNVTLPGIQSEISTYTGSGGRFQPSAVVTVFGGGNDYFNFLDQATPPTLAQVPTEVASVTGNIQSDIRAVVGAGAKIILVPNIPDLGVTPAYSSTSLAGVATALSVQHAAALDAQLGVLAKQLNVNIFVVDFATALHVVEANPARFGFTNISNACVPAAVPGFPASIFPGTPCANPDQYLFWDSVHPTATAQMILAEYAADTLMAPLTIAAQGAFALTNGDSFLRRMQDAMFGSGATGHGSPMASGTFSGSDVFLNVRRGFGDGNPGNGAFGFDYRSNQISGGAFVHPWTNVSLGVIGGFDDGTANLDDSRSSIGLTSYHLGAMGRFDNGSLFAGTGIAYSYDRYSLNRQTYVPQLQSAADTNGHTVSAFGTAGYRFNFGAVTVGPLLALRYTSATIDGYSENGAPGLDMIVQAQRAEQLIGSAGIAASTQYLMGTTMVVPYVNFALERDFMGDNRIIETALVTVPDVGRTFQTGNNDDVYGRVNGGVTFPLAPGNAHGITGTVSGETTIGRSGGNEHAIFGTIRGQL